MNDKVRRLRIGVEKGIEVSDPLDFKPNAATLEGRLFHEYAELGIELWIDKHCHNWQKGGGREGIGIELIEDIVIKSFRYLTNMFLKNPNFQYIKYFKDALHDPRIVLQEENTQGVMLNVVIEIHHLEMSKFEITVKTAMAVNDFRISDGQRILLITHNRAILRKFSSRNQNYIEINSIDLN